MPSTDVFPHPFFSSMPKTLSYHIYMDLPEAVREVSVQQGSGDFPLLCSSAIPLPITSISRYSIFCCDRRCCGYYPALLFCSMPNPLNDLVTVGKAPDRRHPGLPKSSDIVPLLPYDFVNAGDAGRLPSVFCRILRTRSL